MWHTCCCCWVGSCSGTPFGRSPSLPCWAPKPRGPGSGPHGSGGSRQGVCPLALLCLVARQQGPVGPTEPLLSDFLVSICHPQCAEQPRASAATPCPAPHLQAWLRPLGGQTQAGLAAAWLVEPGRSPGREPASPRHLACVQSPAVGSGTVGDDAARGGAVGGAASPPRLRLPGPFRAFGCVPRV